MSVKIDNGLELIMHLDFEHEIPCDNNDCDKAAEWKFIVSCCGKMLVACDPHFQELRKWEKTFGLDHHDGVCEAEDVRILNPERFKVSA